MHPQYPAAPLLPHLDHAAFVQRRRVLPEIQRRQRIYGGLIHRLGHTPAAEHRGVQLPQRLLVGGRFGKVRQQFPGGVIVQFEDTPHIEHTGVLAVLVPADAVLIHEEYFPVRIVALVPRRISHLTPRYTHREHAEEVIDVERRVFVQFQTRLQRIGQHFGHHVVLAAPGTHDRLIFVRKHLPEDVADELLHDVQRDRRDPRPGDQFLFLNHPPLVVGVRHQVAPLIAAHVAHEPFVVAAFPVQLRPVVQAGV